MYEDPEHEALSLTPVPASAALAEATAFRNEVHSSAEMAVVKAWEQVSVMLLAAQAATRAANIIARAAMLLRSARQE